jgi:hypothetical protein
MSGRQVALQVEVKGFIEQAENVVLLWLNRYEFADQFYFMLH